MKEMVHYSKEVEKNIELPALFVADSMKKISRTFAVAGGRPTQIWGLTCLGVAYKLKYGSYEFDDEKFGWFGDPDRKFEDFQYTTFNPEMAAKIEIFFARVKKSPGSRVIILLGGNRSMVCPPTHSPFKCGFSEQTLNLVMDGEPMSLWSPIYRDGGKDEGKDEEPDSSGSSPKNDSDDEGTSRVNLED